MTTDIALSIAQVLARGSHMTGAFSVFGTLFLSTTLLPANTAASLNRTLNSIARSSLYVALLAGLFWFVLESAYMASAQNIAELAAALPEVIRTTRFGHLLAGRCALLVAAVLCFQLGRSKTAVLMAAAAIAAQAWLDHGGAMEGVVGTLLLVSTACHLLCGAAWLGSLPALGLSIKRLPVAEAGRIAQRFSPIGAACVLGLLATAIVQYAFLIARPLALISSSYGRVALFKIILFTALVAIAAFNRQRLTPALIMAASSPGTEAVARKKLIGSIAAEIAFGVLVLMAAGLLLQLAPPAMALMHGQ